MKPPYKIAFMGTPTFAVPALGALLESPDFDVQTVITQPDKPIGRSGKPQPSPVRVLAEKRGVPVLTPERVKKNEELLAQLRAMNLDAIVVVAYGKILPQGLLDIPTMGVVNVHASLLPKHRGASPIVGSILAGDTTTGVTIMKLVLEMDAGPIIATSTPLPIQPTDTTETLTHKLAELGAETLLESLPHYLAGAITPTEQDHTQATFVKLLSKEDGHINWQNQAQLIARQIRAYNPWPTAFTGSTAQPIKILEAEVMDKVTNMPGTVWQTEDGYPAVTADGGSLKLLVVHPAGKKPMSGSDFLKGNRHLVDSTLT